jgi:acyl carrier protein
MKKLEEEVKELIISTLNLEDISAAEINSDEPLFNDGLGLDSIDALELGIALQQTYGINFKSATDDTKKHFYSVKTLAEFVKGMKDEG